MKILLFSLFFCTALPADSWSRYPLSSLLQGYQCVRHDEHISYGNLGDSVPPFGLSFSSGNPPAFSHHIKHIGAGGCCHLPSSSLISLSLSLAGNLQNVLAAANEEGIVRIYNTESRESPLLKGMCDTPLFSNDLSVFRKYEWLMVCALTEWLAHENAVFDIAWVPGEAQLVSSLYIN